MKKRPKIYVLLSFNLFLLFIVVILFIWALLFFLKKYTGHGKTYIMDDFTGLTVEEIISSSSYANIFEFIVSDSLYDNTKKKRTVISQSPLPNSKVKKNRKVYLTIVSSQSEMVSCPNLIDLTVRQATTIAETYGLKIGRVEYVPDIGNTVIEWKQLGKTVNPGDRLIKGSRIDLYVGDNQGDAQTYLPDLLGKTRSEARITILNAGLNMGSEFFLKKDDTISVKVVKQNPPYSEKHSIKLGSLIDLWYE